MKKKTNVTRERRKIIMTENNYSIFDDVTMPDISRIRIYQNTTITFSNT